MDFVLRIIQMVLNEKRNPPSDGGSVLHGVTVFLSRFPYGKGWPNYRAVSPRSAPLDRVNKARGGPIRIWLLGSGPEKRRSLFLSFLYLLRRLHLFFSLLLALGSNSREAKPPLLSGGTYVLRGQTDFRPGACT